MLKPPFSTILEAMNSAMVRGHRIEIRGFGSFSVIHRASRMGRNPRSGAPVEIPAARMPHFKPGKAAAAGADWTKSFYQILTNQPGKDSWPISGATFILMHAKQDKPANASEVLKFFNWTYANGGKAAADLDYVPMPPAVVTAIQKSWGDIKDNAGKPVAYK